VLAGCTSRRQVVQPSAGGSDSSVVEQSPPDSAAADNSSSDPSSPPSDGTTSPSTDPTPTGDPCATSNNAAPEAPSILQPLAGAVGIEPSDFTIAASAFVDVDGDALGSSEFELWRVRNGELASLVWHATPGSAVSALRLSDGAFVGAGASGLAPWTSYAVRARYGDANACPRLGEWSAPAEFRTDDGSAMLFDPELVRRFDLTIPPESFAAINAEAIPPGCQVYDRHTYPASLSFEGQTFDDIGLHAKGGCGAARDLSGKAGFKANLSWDDPAVPGCPAERRLFGESKLTFNNGVQDVTLAHEALGYAYFRALGLPAPRLVHVRLYVNGEYWGVYLNFETLDRRFLRRWFVSQRGMMYEGSYQCDLVPENLPPTDDTTTCLQPGFDASPCNTVEPGDDPLGYDMARQLVAKIQALPPGGFYPAVASFFEFDRFLLQWAADSVIGHWDSYEDWGRGNYRVYHDPATDKWSMIETDIDLAFVDDNDPWKIKAILAERCLSEPACEAAFDQKLQVAVDRFEAMDLAAEAERIHDRILPYVTLDPRKSYDMPTFEADSQALQAWIKARPAFMRERLRLHGL
jgi:spore coat protein CotH